MTHQATSYERILEYLYEMLPAYQRIGSKAFKKDLTNVITLCQHLGDPQHKFHSIHIAGSNGKGSVSNMLSSVFQEAGYKTGIYTSPHISDFRERIQVNGKLMPKNSVIAFVRRMKPVIKEIRPSFFEVTVAMAFDHFCRQQVDVAIVETGLGGRLDSTNILRPDLAIITNISLEHQAILGNSLQEIAGEKAGIIKENTAVIIGRTQKETKAVFRQTAKRLNAPIQFADQLFEAGESKYKAGKRLVKIRRKTDKRWHNYTLDLSAKYQQENVQTVLAAVDVINQLDHFKLSASAIKRGLKRTTINNRFSGRWQVIGQNPLTILDGSHNADGIKKVVEQLADEDYEQLHIIFGCVADKDLQAILPKLPKKARYYLTEPNVERKKNVKALAAEFLDQNLGVEFISEFPVQCLDAARARSSQKDMILITGSLFLLSSFL